MLFIHISLSSFQLLYNHKRHRLDIDSERDLLTKINVPNIGLLELPISLDF